MVKFYHSEFLWFWSLIILAILALIYNRIQHRKSLQQYAGIELSQKLLEGYRPGLRRLKNNLWLVGLVFLGIALLGPAVGQKLTEVKRRGQDIIIALDTSISMKAEDVKPNRLERAKFELNRFIDGLMGDRIGIVAFAGTSYLQCPLTLDYSAAKLFLDACDTGIIGTQGTAIADAISTSLKAFKSGEKKHKVIILISDGEDHEGDINQIAKQAAEEGVVIYAVGIGSLTGAPIPLRNITTGEVEFKKDRAGHIVMTALEEETMQKIAALTGGKYYNLSANKDAFQKIAHEISGMDKKNLQSHEYSDYQQRYQIFLLIGLVLLTTEILIPEKRNSTSRDTNS
ncbi:MAG TPA: VWA domain-containing protein [Candidatus Marinimicrobia bacterium]|nr:VWA domain-containing protein [Candidatus Neomarinimicrobiota bacterium]HPB00245.1 VWA domain-containing protein [Candidatus Neomarinimicrobiota bacterium]HPI26975.1 VWA domain-containing protein [Candidatus Neomarinimicrobiota bacterium]HPY00032.1 VWA domain-containing protein [Candidatus Neomarinimicrobiota bacterium]